MCNALQLIPSKILELLDEEWLIALLTRFDLYQLYIKQYCIELCNIYIYSNFNVSNPKNITLTEYESDGKN